MRLTRCQGKLARASALFFCACNEALAAELAEAAGDFSNPENVPNVMARIFHALIRRRISAKEAGVLCYIAQTILHSHRAILLQQKLDAEAAAAKQKNRKINYILDLPEALRGPIDEPNADEAAVQPEEQSTLESNPSSSPTDPQEGTVSTVPNAARISGTLTPEAPADKLESSSVTSSPSTPSPSSTSSTSPQRLPPPVVSPPKPPGFYDHFYPIDPSLPPGAQDLSRNIPPPSQAELDRRNARFARAHGYRR